MADSGGEGAAGGASHLSVVVAWAAMPQSFDCSVITGILERELLPVKVQPSLVSTVAVVDVLIFLELGCGFLRVFLVELTDEVGGVFKVTGGVPGTIGVVETGPLDSILNLVSIVSEVEDFFYFPLLLFLYDHGRWRWLLVFWDGLGASCRFEKADVEDWVNLDSGRQVQFIYS